MYRVATHCKTRQMRSHLPLSVVGPTSETSLAPFTSAFSFSWGNVSTEAEPHFRTSQLLFCLPRGLTASVSKGLASSKSSHFPRGSGGSRGAGDRGGSKPCCCRGCLYSSVYPVSQGSPREPGQVGAGAQTLGKGWGQHPADFLAQRQARADCCVQEIFNILCLKERVWKGSKTILNTSAGSYTDGNLGGGRAGEGDKLSAKITLAGPAEHTVSTGHR